MRNILDIYGTDIMRRALLESIIVGALCGVVGVHVVLRRLPFFTVTVAHATFPGVVIASLIGIGELVGGVMFALLLTILIYVAGADRQLDHSALVGVALAGSFGVGAMLQSTQDGFTKDLAAVLVGSVLTVDDRDVVVTAIAGVAIVVFLAAFHKELVLRAFDPQGSEALGYPRALDLALLVVVAVTVVTTVPVVGTMLSIALLSVPALTARLVTTHVRTAMLAAPLYGAGAGAVGLTASAEWDISAGAAIAMTSAAFFFVTWVVTALVRSVRRRAAIEAATALQLP